MASKIYDEDNSGYLSVPFKKVIRQVFKVIVKKISVDDKRMKQLFAM